MSDSKQSIKKVRGDHCLNIFVSHELKSSLKALAEKYDRTTSDMVRAVLRVGIPMMEGLSQAEELMVKEYISLFRKLRQVRSLKEV
jgi:predicted DNA-binding protein